MRLSTETVVSKCTCSFLTCCSLVSLQVSTAAQNSVDAPEAILWPTGWRCGTICEAHKNKMLKFLPLFGLSVAVAGLWNEHFTKMPVTKRLKGELASEFGFMCCIWKNAHTIVFVGLGACIWSALKTNPRTRWSKRRSWEKMKEEKRKISERQQFSFQSVFGPTVEIAVFLKCLRCGLLFAQARNAMVWRGTNCTSVVFFPLLVCLDWEK